MNYSVTKVLIKYYSFPTQESSVITQEPVPFPDNTVCNIDPISGHQYNQLASDPTSHLSWYVNLTSRVGESIANRMPDSVAVQYIDDRFNSTNGLYEYLPIEEIEEISHKKENLLLNFLLFIWWHQPQRSFVYIIYYFRALHCG